jgi:large subunit ribosomal protein L30
MSNTKQIKVTLTKSIFGRVKGHKECVNGLGLRKPYQSVVIPATPENLGMVNKAYYLLKVEEVA